MAVVRRISEPDIIKFNDSPGGMRKIRLQEGLSRFYEITDPVVMKPDTNALYMIVAVDHQLDILTLRFDGNLQRATTEEKK